MCSVNRLVLVTTALRLEDGGAASLSRAIADAAQDYCCQHNLDFEILDLGQPSDVMQGVKVRYFMGNQLVLARMVWKRALLSRKTAFIFAHIGPARTLGVLPRLLLPPYMLWILGVEVWRPLTFLQRRAMILATMRVAISGFTERRTREYHPWMPATDVLLLALEDRPITDEPDVELLKQVSENAILIVGRLSASERYKGHDELLQAMPAVIKQCSDAQLVIVGKGDDLPRLQAETARLGIGDHVLFTGFVSDATLQNLFQRCRIFAMPSRNEGFGLVFLEAMKAARPCVALRNSSAAEIIVDGVTGTLIDSDEQLAPALARLLKDNAYSVQLGKAGYKRWQEEFTRSTFDVRFHRLLDQLCGAGT